MIASAASLRSLLAAIVVILALAVSACTPNQGNVPGFQPNGPWALSETVHQPASTAAKCVILQGRADRRCTPGALNPAITQDTIHGTICVPGWSASVRPPTAFTNRVKRLAMVNYGIIDPPSTVELDHLIPISVGGFPGDARNISDPRNLAQLWPESWTGTPNAHTKDLQEHAVHAAICADRITLKQGQDQLLAKWTHP